jgi:hypothetical protein
VKEEEDEEEEEADGVERSRIRSGHRTASSELPAVVAHELRPHELTSPRADMPTSR